MSQLYRMVSPPFKGSAFTFYVALRSQASMAIFQVNPTLAVGDVKVDKDGAGLVNIAALPTVIGAGKMLAVTLSATEMNANVVSVMFSDVAGNEWLDLMILIRTVEALAIDEITIVDSVVGSTITIHRGDTFTGTLATDPTAGYVSIDFSIKYSLDDLDDNAVLRIRKNASGLNDGLLRLNGVAAPDATKASLIIAANSVQIDIDETITSQLPIPREQYYYDLQLITATTVTTLSEGRLDVNRDVTRLTS